MNDNYELFIVAVMEYLEKQKLDPEGRVIYLQAEKLLGEIEVYPNI